MKQSQTTETKKKKPGRPKGKSKKQECIRPSHRFPIGMQAIFSFYSKVAYESAHQMPSEGAQIYIADLFATLTASIVGAAEKEIKSVKGKPGPKKGFKRRKKRKVLQ